MGDGINWYFLSMLEKLFSLYDKSEVLVSKQVGVDSKYIFLSMLIIYIFVCVVLLVPYKDRTMERKSPEEDGQIIAIF